MERSARTAAAILPILTASLQGAAPVTQVSGAWGGQGSQGVVSPRVITNVPSPKQEHHVTPPSGPSRARDHVYWGLDACFYVYRAQNNQRITEIPPRKRKEKI